MHRKDIKGRWWEFTPKETRITKETPKKQRAFLTDDALKLIGMQMMEGMSSRIKLMLPVT